MRSRVRSSAVAFWVGIFVLVCWSGQPRAEELRVMSFNLWHGGDAGKQPLSQTIEVIRAAHANLVGLQETRGFEPTPGATRPNNGARLAQMLGWQYFDQGDGTGILSQYPLVTNTPRKWGVQVRLPSGRTVMLFNAHLSHAPYQPYQLLNIPYANAPFIKTADEAVKAAQEARGGQVERLLSEVRLALDQGETVFVTGDFNEPSHQDWTPRAAQAGKCPLSVPYPSTRAVTAAGLRDAYRTVHPDEVAHPGWTWTPLTQPNDPKDRHDRIDFVFFGGRDVSVKSCEVIGERTTAADKVVVPYPSDHRAVVASFELGQSR
ncbi:MAG TPA: endonuclease/exonuclease/phosphatase family protein [Verrucomicrobiota bacterium]|nr:endonuclease/exonuclease/phosphatase family protein [Verrucomicrobiota bacterium]